MCYAILLQLSLDLPYLASEDTQEVAVVMEEDGKEVSGDFGQVDFGFVSD